MQCKPDNEITSPYFQARQDKTTLMKIKNLTNNIHRVFIGRVKLNLLEQPTLIRIKGRADPLKLVHKKTDRLYCYATQQ